MKKGLIISLLIAAATAVVAIIAIKSAGGERVPIHWNINGEVDGYGSPLTLLIFPITSLLVTLLLYFLPKIDPKGENIRKSSGSILSIMMILISVLMLGITVIIAKAINDSADILNLITFILLALGMMFIALGYYLPGVKHNYMVGIRTPWTLYSEKIWVKTHEASKWWFISAGALCLVGILFESPWNLILPLVYALVVSAGVAVYSYVLFAEEKRGKRK